MAPKFSWDDMPDGDVPSQPKSDGKFDWDSLPDHPNSEPGLFDGAVKSTIDSLPMIGGVVGGALGTPADVVAGPMGNVAGAAVGGYLGTATKNLINSYYDPQSAPKTLTEAVAQPVVGGVAQGLAQGAGEAVAPYVAKGIQAAVDPTADALRSFAAKKAIAATGATGKQAANFAPGAGQELLDQGIVKFGNSQASVAQKATDALDKTGKQIGDLLSSLDSKGATLDQADIVDSLRKRAAQLGDDPAQYGVSDSLNKLADRIQTTIESKGGNSTIPLSQAENTKRGFQAAANYNSSPMDLSISKEASSIYQKAVEDAATKFDPKTAEQFTAAKKAYGLLSPVQDAAEKRALTLSQSPHGGLLDTAAIIAGEGIAGAPGAIVAPMVRRAVSSRVAPSMAASANIAGKALGGVPAIAESAAPAALQLPSSAVPSAVNSGSRALISVPAAAQNQNQPLNRTPAVGEDKWAQQGLQGLGIQDPALSQKLLSDPKAKQLLIQASDLKPGSKAMQQIMNQIKSGWGSK